MADPNQLSPQQMNVLAGMLRGAPSYSGYEIGILRDQIANDRRDLHNVVGPEEHAETARDFINRGPGGSSELARRLRGTLMGGAIPVYTALKLAGALRTRSDPSMDEVRAANRAIQEELPPLKEPDDVLGP